MRPLDGATLRRQRRTEATAGLAAQPLPPLREENKLIAAPPPPAVRGDYPSRPSGDSLPSLRLNFLLVLRFPTTQFLGINTPRAPIPITRGG
ncbi:unnamed protein product, partial [Nesidiocoris tenuis]